MQIKDYSIRRISDEIMEYWSNWQEVTEEEYKNNYTEDKEKWTVVFNQDTNKPSFMKRIKE